MKKAKFVPDYEAAKPTQDQIDACRREVEAAAVPGLETANSMLTEALKKAGITPDQVYTKMAELRNVHAQFEAWKNQQPKGNK